MSLKHTVTAGWLPRLALAAVAAAAATAPARADAIDGDWCFGVLNLNIQGPKIRIPSGAEITGAYTRHTFQYVVPANETGAGTTIDMRLYGEEHMELMRGTAAPEVWRRCKPVS